MMAKITGQEYVHYITKQLVEYMEMPVDDRRQAKKAAKANKEPWLLRWFGVGGASLLMWIKKKDQ